MCTLADLGKPPRIDKVKLDNFIGGQAEIQQNIRNHAPERVLRGEIKKFDLLADGGIRIYFNWLAELLIGKRWWTMINTVEYTVGTIDHSAHNVGPGDSGGDRVYFQHVDATESIALFPIDGSRISADMIRSRPLVL